MPVAFNWTTKTLIEIEKFVMQLKQIWVKFYILRYELSSLYPFIYLALSLSLTRVHTHTHILKLPFNANSCANMIFVHSIS